MANGLHRIRWSLLDLVRDDRTHLRSVCERHRKYLNEICVVLKAIRRKRATHVTFVVL